MDGAFERLVVDRLVADGHQDAEWAWLILAACDGSEALSAVLNGTAQPRPVPEASPAAPGPAVEPPGAYLSSITVGGFRGIAATASLQFTPGPGLTLVVGRNGSGKSSFAEALELLLTGANKRWDGRAVALIGRQGLERALDEFWQQRVPGVEQAPRSAQLLCLDVYLEDVELAQSVRYAWHALSRACHHHVYELPLTAEEIEALLGVAERMVVMASHARGPRE